MVAEEAQLAENVPSMNEALRSIPALHKPDILAHICSTCTQEVKASGSEYKETLADTVSLAGRG